MPISAIAPQPFDRLRANGFNQRSPKKILLINTRRIGDVLLTTPLIRSLRRAWPEAVIDVLVFASTAGILASNPDIDQVITVAERPDWRGHLRLLRRIWRRYDLALSTLTGDRPTLYAWAAAKHSAGLVEEGSKHDWKRRLLSQSAPFDNVHTHTVLMNLKLADLLGIPRCHELVSAWSEQDAQSVAAMLPFDPMQTEYAVLHTYPMFAYKTWHRAGWIELARWLAARGLRVVLVGGKQPDEMAYVDALLPQLPPDTINTTGRLSLGAVAYLLSRAQVYVGTDTSVTHIAAGLGVPTVALYGPSNPVKWGPWPKGYERDTNPYRMRGSQTVNNVTLLQGSGDCVPCMQEGCERHVNSLSACLQQMPADLVIAAVEQQLLTKAGGIDTAVPG